MTNVYNTVSLLYGRFQPYQKYFAFSALALSVLPFVGVRPFASTYLFALLILSSLLGYGPRNIFLGFVLWVLLFFEITPLLCTGSFSVGGATCFPGFALFGGTAYFWAIFSQVLGSVVLWGLLLAGLEWIVRSLVARYPGIRVGSSQAKFFPGLLASLGLGFLLYLSPVLLQLFTF